MVVGNTITNTPIANFGAFRLEIVPCAGSVFPMQRIYRALKNNPDMFIRYYENGWGAWKQVTTTSV